MEVSGAKQGKAYVVTVNGRMDTTTAPEFERTVTEWMGRGESTFIVDLTGLEYISSAGLRSILMVGKKLKAQKGSLAFCSLAPMVAKVFSISNFTALFPIYDSLEAALQES